MFKRIVSLFMAALILAACVLSVSCVKEDESDFTVTEKTKSIDYSKYAGTTINVYNWGEYISDGSEGSVDVNEEFTALTGIKVNYTNFTSNEDMYSKMKSGGLSYDIIIPSDYMIGQLISENMLQKINFDNIPNYKNIDEQYKNLYFDENNEYSVPYNVGITGIIYNTKLVNYTPDSWSILWDKNLKDQILMFNNPRDAFGVAQFYLGIDINTEDKAELKKVQSKLLEQKPLVKAYVMDEVFNKMESGSAAVAPYYAGDFFTMYENNPDLAFVLPKEGANMFVDSMCIPTSAKNKEAAELYINFLLDENVALQNAMEICYTSPNKAVATMDEYNEFLSELHPKAREYMYPDLEAVYPDIPSSDLYFHKLSDEALNEMSTLWSDLKIATVDNSDSSSLYVICAVIIVLAVGTFVFFKIRKSKRNKA